MNIMKKEFLKEYEKLINKHIEEDEEILNELKITGKFERGLDGNHEDFKKLHQKQWQEVKELCDQYGITHGD